MQVDFSALLGKTLMDMSGSEGEDTIHFRTSDGKHYEMYHDQDCCEHVYIEEIIGSRSDILNSPLVVADERTHDGDPQSEYDESCTWTFYHLCTVNGCITIRWYGTSNGYYSKSVLLREVEDSNA